MSRVNDPRMLQRRHSDGNLNHLREAAAKANSLNPGRLKSQPSVPDSSPFDLPLDGEFRYEADRARGYAAQTIGATKDRLPPLRVAPESALMFKASPSNVAFCGVVSLKDKTTYLCPLVSMRGSEEFPADKVKCFSVAHNIAATPILHTDVARRQATGTGEASHDQLAKRIGAADECIGFTIWKGDNGDAVNFSFTSRSQNTSKFGRCATAAEVAAEAARNEQAKTAFSAAQPAYKKTLEEFKRNLPAATAERARAHQTWKENGSTGIPPPSMPPLPPPPPTLEQFGYSVKLAKEATLTSLQERSGDAKGVNPEGIVSLPYAVAVLDTLQTYFNSGLSTSAEAPT